MQILPALKEGFSVPVWLGGTQWLIPQSLPPQLWYRTSMTYVKITDFLVPLSFTDLELNLVLFINQRLNIYTQLSIYQYCKIKCTFSYSIYSSVVLDSFKMLFRVCFMCRFEWKSKENIPSPDFTAKISKMRPVSKLMSKYFTFLRNIVFEFQH